MSTKCKNLVVALAVSVTALAAESCGGTEEEANDNAALRSVVEQVARTDPAACDHLSDRFKVMLFRGSGCEKAFGKDRTVRSLRVEGVRVGERSATVKVEDGFSGGVYRFVKEEGEWKLDGYTVAAPQRGKPVVRRGLSPRETVSAYYDAIRDGSAARFCGLLSDRYARRLTGASRRASAAGECVEQLANYDWRAVRKRARKVSVGGVKTGSTTATVALSNGKRARLVKLQPDRWVVDDIAR